MCTKCPSRPGGWAQARHDALAPPLPKRFVDRRPCQKEGRKEESKEESKEERKEERKEAATQQTTIISSCSRGEKFDTAGEKSAGRGARSSLFPVLALKVTETSHELPHLGVTVAGHLGLLGGVGRDGMG